jgi:Raf kinase inhibitor-like YbhB/YbcL family protein
MKMRKSLLWLSVGLLTSAPALAQTAEVPTPATMQMTSPSFTDGGAAPEKHTCLSANPVSPGFTWIDAPKATVSFTLIFHDPDVHPNKGIDDSFHWAVWNIPGAAKGIAEGLPKQSPLADGSQQTQNAAGVIGYAPMCGRPGKKQHYVFELYALDTKLTVSPKASRNDLLKAMDGHILGKNMYVGRFSKPGPVGPVE